MEQVKFAYSTLEKDFVKQIEKHFVAIKSLDLSNKKRWIKTSWRCISTKSDEWFD